MAASTLQIRSALKAALDNAVTGVSGWQTSAYMLSLPQPPTIDIYPASTVFDTAMARGNDELLFVVRGLVAFNQDIGAQISLDRLMDATSATGIKTVVEADRSLGGVVQDCRVTACSGYKSYIVDGQPPLLGAEFTVSVYP